MISFWIVLAILIVAILIGLPIAFSVGLSTIVYMLIINPSDILIMPLKMFTGVDSFILMALPLFSLAADIMVRTGISSRLFDFVRIFIGRFRGGLAYVNIFASTIFGSLAGAALSDVAGLGRVEIEAMKEDGYDLPFAGAITAASSIQSPLIPPSNIAVLYAGIMGVSVGAVLMAGAVPGLMIALSQCIYVFLTRKRYPKHEKKYALAEIYEICKNGIAALIMPLIIIGGIVGGLVTPTEAAGVAVFYSFVVGIVMFRNLKLNDVIQSLFISAKTSAGLFLIISISAVFAWAIGNQRVPQQIAQVMLSISDSPYVFLIIVNVIFIIVGMWMETGAGIILFAPIFAPIAATLGIHPIHFAVVMVVNLTIGLLTPPVGVVLYAVSAVGKIRFEHLVKATLPFIVLAFCILAVLTFVPDLALLVPRLLGYID